MGLLGGPWGLSGVLELLPEVPAGAGGDFGGAVTKPSLFVRLWVPDALKSGTSITLRGAPCGTGLRRNTQLSVIIFINEPPIWGKNNSKLFSCGVQMF